MDGLLLNSLAVPAPIHTLLQRKNHIRKRIRKLSGVWITTSLNEASAGRVRDMKTNIILN